MAVPLQNLKQIYILTPQTERNETENIQVITADDSCEDLVFVNEEQNGTKQQRLQEVHNANNYNSWSANCTKSLIHAYKLHRPKVGSFEIRNLKKMWEVVAQYLFEKFNLCYTATNCENRWRVLERNYIKYIHNNNRTGRGRKYFEFAKEMDEIFVKKNIYPEILLSSDEIIKSSSESVSDTEQKRGKSKDAENKTDNVNIQADDGAGTSRAIMSTQGKLKRKFAKNTTKRTVLEEIRNDRLKYQNEMLKLQQKRNDEKAELEKEKLKELKRKNDLIEKRNALLEEFVKKTNNSTDLPVSLL